MLLGVSLLGCLAGLVAGLGSGPLWLDETLSVEIARLPPGELYAALRQDGAPPLYYLLLHGWMAVFGEGSTAVRLPSVLLTAVALLLAYRLSAGLAGLAGGAGRLAGGRGRLDPVAAGRTGVVVLAALPWTMRFGSEARMYQLVVVLVLAGALALLAVHRSPSRRAVLGLAAAVAGLLFTHYWSLFLLAAVALMYLPGLLRRRPAALRVAVAGGLGAVAFLPWLPTFLFQAARTGAPWADQVVAADLLRTPLVWGGGTATQRTMLALVLVPLVLLAAIRLPVARRSGAVVVVTLVLAWTSVAIGGGAYSGRYTAVVVPVFAVTAGLGALVLPGRQLPLVALAVATALGIGTGVPTNDAPRTSAGPVAAAFRASANPGELLVYCPDQLGPPVARLLGPDYPQVVYPTLEAPQRIDWVDYRARQDAADPTAVAARVDALAGDRPLFVLTEPGYRTFEGDCVRLLRAVGRLRGPVEPLFGTVGSAGPVLWRFP